MVSPRAVGFTRLRCISARALRAFSTELANSPGLVRSLAQSIKVIARSASSARNPNQLGIACAILMCRSNRTTHQTGCGTEQPGAGGEADRDEEARLTAVLGDVALYRRTCVLGFNPRFIKRLLIFRRPCSCFASQRPCGAGVGQCDPAMLLNESGLLFTFHAV